MDFRRKKSCLAHQVQAISHWRGKSTVWFVLSSVQFLFLKVESSTFSFSHCWWSLSEKASAVGAGHSVINMSPNSILYDSQSLTGSFQSEITVVFTSELCRHVVCWQIMLPENDLVCTAETAFLSLFNIYIFIYKTTNEGKDLVILSSELGALRAS